MSTDTEGAAERLTVEAVRGLATIPLWSPDPTVPTAARLLDISRTLAYQSAADGSLPVIRLGSKVLVAVPRLLAMLGATEDPQDAPEAAAGDRDVTTDPGTVPVHAPPAFLGLAPGSSAAS